MDDSWEVDPVEAVNSDAGAPFVEMTRADWARLAAATPIRLDDSELERLRGTGDPTNQRDVVEVYLPLTQLINLYVDLTGRLYDESHDFLGLTVRRTPFVIGVAGSVAVGKSTTSRLLRELLRRGPGRPKVDLITTDGFLYPNDELKRRGIFERKGFPESYDRRALQSFVMDVKSGKAEVHAPVYSHLSYDIVPGERIVVREPDILIVEGLNVLQPARPRPDGSPSALAVSDFFDFSVYVDAEDDHVRNWYIQRFLELRRTAFADPRSYFTRYSKLSEQEAVETAGAIWDSINGPNLAQNIRPTRGRATAVLRKGADHEVSWVRIRKV